MFSNSSNTNAEVYYQFFSLESIEVENEKNSRILAVMDNINDKCFKICSKCLSRYLDMSNEELNKFDI